MCEYIYTYRERDGLVGQDDLLAALKISSSIEESQSI